MSDPKPNYDCLTAAYAKSRTLSQLCSDTNAQERGLKMAMTKRGISTCKDYHKEGDAKSWTKI